MICVACVSAFKPGSVMQYKQMRNEAWMRVPPRSAVMMMAGQQLSFDPDAVLTLQVGRDRECTPSRRQRRVSQHDDSQICPQIDPDSFPSKVLDVASRHSLSCRSRDRSAVTRHECG